MRREQRPHGKGNREEETKTRDTECGGSVGLVSEQQQGVGGGGSRKETDEGFGLGSAEAVEHLGWGLPV